MTSMSKRAIHMLAISTLAFGLAACGKSEEKTAGQKLDSAISQTQQAAENAGSKLEDSAAKAGDATTNAMEKAGDKIASVADSAGAKMEQEAAKAGAALDDAGITAQVKADLIKEPNISALKIDVDTKSGVVTLSGTVPSEALKTRAGELAKAVKGVGNVNNNLTVG
ncbi:MULTISPECIES: BON domain-containing protein [unclassified Comamonas]|uniref:BON domain-containing protein n=1 Tax=unclassified Comamonas TaxID=2638500 RepID=UPI000EACF38C|nr:BON domain-containing protein [Comamonas sp. lk]